MPEMMAVNFLRERVRVQEGVLEADRKLALISAGVLAIVVVIAAGVFSYGVFLRSQLAKVEDTIKEQERIARSYEPTQLAFQTVREKLEIIKQLLEKRQGKWDAITYFHSRLPAGTTISTVSLAANDSSLELLYQSENITQFERLLSSFQDPAIAQQGYGLSLGSVSRSRKGTYDIAVGVQVAQKKATPAPRVRGNQ